jgi:hypothetical protein
VPKNFGQKQAGTIKADEWHTLATIHIPLALITLWGYGQDAHNLKLLNHAMTLFQAVSIAMKYTVTEDLVTSYRELMVKWTNDLRILFPEIEQQKRT